MLISKRGKFGGTKPPFCSLCPAHSPHPDSLWVLRSDFVHAVSALRNSVTTLQAIACTSDSHGFFDDISAIEKTLVYCCAASFALHLVPDSLFYHLGFGEERSRDERLGYASHHPEIGGANGGGPRDHDAVMGLSHHRFPDMGLSISHFFFSNAYLYTPLASGGLFFF